MSRILPLRTGWDPSPDDPGFYPDGLPDDWRLAYFANEADAVFVAAGAWSRAADGWIEQWRAEVPPGFRFYLETGPKTGPETGFESDAPPRTAVRLVSVQGLLGDRFGGWVRTPGTAVPPRAPCYALIESFVAPLPASCDGLACPVPGGLLRAPREARGWFERLAAAAPGRPVLALLGAVPMEDLRRCRTLVQLLGVG